jgi:2-polyprenyl-3-methyl-5-hydroxy-6-metoxy-1,4-benzoquinol methylase
MNCCSGAAYPAAERQFGPAVAARDMERYERKGPDAATRLLLTAVRDAARAGDSLLDVGGGVGVVSLELLSAGVNRATIVEASPSYLDAARRSAEQKGFANRLQFLAGDFTAIAASIEPADTVTMHRVVCCYPRYEPLLGEAARCCRRALAFSYPHDRWYLRAWIVLDNMCRRILRNPFRTFVHPAAAMERILVAAGFQRVSRQRTLVWCVDLYRRLDDRRTSSSDSD